jgi:hypothetical protein
MRRSHSLSRSRRLALWASLAAVPALVAASPAGASPAAQAGKTCTPPSYPGSGYFTSLNVKRTTCRTGKRVALAYYRCRTRHGVSGRCHSKVLGYRCKERRQSIPTEIDARVTCRRGKATVVHTYQQNR